MLYTSERAIAASGPIAHGPAAQRRPAMPMPKRVVDRVVPAVQAFRPIIESQLARDVSEADTVTLVKDILSDVFGFNKYTALTSEHSIRGTYCGLAVKIDTKLAFMIGVK